MDDYYVHYISDSKPIRNFWKLEFKDIPNCQYNTKLDTICNTHVCWRKVKGDGNCYYRSVIFNILEQMLYLYWNSIHNLEMCLYNYVSEMENVDKVHEMVDDKSINKDDVKWLDKVKVKGIGSGAVKQLPLHLQQLLALVGLQGQTQVVDVTGGAPISALKVGTTG